MELYFCQDPSFEDMRTMLHTIGYSWVRKEIHYQLLLRSINRRGASWNEAKRELESPQNKECFKYGPDPREGWIYEINKIIDERRPKIDYSKLEHLSWVEKMKIEMDANAFANYLNDKEEREIVEKWYRIWSGIPFLTDRW